MAVTAKSLGIDKLDLDERLNLVEEIWEGIAAEAKTLPLSDEQKAELDRRIAEADANPNAGVPWEKIKADTLDRLNS